MNKNFEHLFRKKDVQVILRETQDDVNNKYQLKRNLKVVDLTSLGIAAIIGAGIFSTIGNASVNGGPAVSLLFVFTAVACGFSAMCYARFASTVPVSGSAYTYAYVSFGELIAWIIGWDLIMEYAVGNIAVAISWSDYFTGLMKGLGMNFPDFLSIDYLSAMRGFKEATLQSTSGIPFDELSVNLQNASTAWTSAPQVFGLRIIADIPAFGIVALISTLIYIGIREAKIASNIMVLIKVSILLVVISIGAFWVNPQNWDPFAPNGLGGVLKGVSGVFFAYIGFDAISTTAEECKNPQKELPRAMILSLLITTVLYVAVSLILTGMVNYKELGVGDPLAYVFSKLNLPQLSGFIAFGAIIAMASVLLVFQIGQPRIWMSMSRDGLLPKKFSKIHPRFKTPSFSTVIAGILVAVPTLFLNLTEVTDLTSIGTLFAFVLVSGGVLIMEKKQLLGNDPKSFKIPYISSRYIIPILWILVLFAILYFNQKGFNAFFSSVDPDRPEASFWSIFKHKIPMYGFLIVAIIMTFFSVKNKLSLIPVMGLITNLYLMTELGITNWLRFLIWLAIGLVLYFTFGRKHSLLRKENRV
jgi:APA family basic amino acid/polyamine antiporter